MKLFYIFISDINECSSNPCSSKHVCLNTDGSFYCLLTSQQINLTAGTYKIHNYLLILSFVIA